MASHPDFVNYMAEQLREAGAIRSRKMFGEYGLYCDDVFFAVVCDDQLFVKVTPQGEAAFPDLPKAPPYEGARDSFLVEDVENRAQGILSPAQDAGHRQRARYELSGSTGPWRA